MICPVTFLGVSYADLLDWPVSGFVSNEVGPALMKLQAAAGWLMSTTIGVAYSAPDAGRGSA